jgi:hypothetical protein
VNGGAAAGLIVMFFGSFDPGGNCIGLLRGWVGVAARRGAGMCMGCGAA